MKPLFRSTRGGWLSLALLPCLLASNTHAAIPEKMQAIRADNGVMKLTTVDVPKPSNNQVLIQVYASSANPSDWRGIGVAGMPNSMPAGAPGGAPPQGNQTGGPPGGAGGPPPGGAGGPPGGAGMGGGMMNRNPGFDAAGVVVAVGANVTEFKVGDAVIAALQESGGGAYAEYAAANVDKTIPKPKNITFQEAAGIPTAGFTGLRMVILGKVKQGDRVLVIGAAGGVGSTAVQAAKARGATVISSASSKHEAYLKSLGVNEIISYDKDDVTAKAKNIDVTIVTVGSENANAIKYTKKGGTVVTIAGQADAAACSAAGVTCVSGGPGASLTIKELLVELGQMAQAGKLSVKVDKVYPLAEVNAAYEEGRKGNREGKIIIAVRSDSNKK
jgi:NADPH:quinone reductase-like Zn-dependent oxidoreductase